MTAHMSSGGARHGQLFGFDDAKAERRGKGKGMGMGRLVAS